MACDANMEAMQFRSGEWSREAKAQVKALHGGVSTYRAEGAGDNEIGKVLDHFILNESVDIRIGNVEVVEEDGSRPHKPVGCEIRLAKVDKGNEEQ